MQQLMEYLYTQEHYIDSLMLLVLNLKIQDWLMFRIKIIMLILLFIMCFHFYVQDYIFEEVES
jgi:acyl carrier protein